MKEDGNNLFFFETPGIVSKKIYKYLKLKEKRNIIDIGAGKGSLIWPIIKNKIIHKTAIEVNEKLQDELRSIYDDVFVGNLLVSSIRNLIIEIPRNSVYVSNPPFGRINCTNEIQSLLFSQGLSQNPRLAKTCRVELIFMARVLEAASIGDEAAFIIPASILENSDFKFVRGTLFREHNLHTCFMLSDKTFKRTEVRTAIVWLRPHTVSDNKSVRIYQENGDKLIIDSNKFIEHGISFVDSICKSNHTLSSLILSMKRGRSSKISLLQRNIEHIHTSDLNRRHAQVIHSLKKSDFNKDIPSENVAHDGDILIARVGTRVLGKAAIFSGNNTVISDCVVRLKVADSDRNIIFKQLVSERGQNWLKSVASGSCARVLTYDAINNFPIGL
ncbi:MAG: N-6 DNA methylase [Methylotenera sp.]|nr:N-6 DNA methylase [Methylotenera sp.]